MLLTLTLAATTSQAHNTLASAPLRVTFGEGRKGGTKVGKPRWKDERLQLTGRQPGKFTYDEIESLEDPFPPTPAHARQLRLEYAKRVAKGKTAKAAASLGTWAFRRGLFAEAKASFERALELNPAQASARAALGQLKDGAGWQATADLIRAERAALAQRGLKTKAFLKELCKLSRKAARNGEPALALELLIQGIRTDYSHKQARKQLKPLTDRYVHHVELSSPLRGRWKASEDVTRHHQLGPSAIYALDLVKVDVSGDHFEEGGRFRLNRHYAYGQPFYAAAPGRVGMVREGHPDLPIGKLGPSDTSNLVAIDHGQGEWTWYVHAQPKSIVVKEGQQVTRGQLLGKVGNSGKSSISIPHLHFALSLQGMVSVPWRLRDFKLIAPDGTKIPVTQACPREGWIFEVAEPAAPAPEK
ncbi:MAG: peptidoglycan DD-metalloendopeptidase family protein [Planctomycetes bacterium]|nr:peptidoglycan DD-metalloendopeptidase family protein [Planctomycetota bacterium]